MSIRRCKSLLLLFCLACLSLSRSFAQRFTIEDGQFLLDGKAFQIIGGEMHYARIPHEYWRDRLLKARAMGLNTVATYVFWNVHEPRQDEFNFNGNADVAEFVELAKEVGLFVILRPGPYACAEWEFGGYPSWLLKNPDLKVRTRDEGFLKACERYIKRLGKELVSLQTTHDGPIIMVQVENEYGSFGKDIFYEGKIRDMIYDAGFNVPLFTADGPGQCKNAHLDGVLPAINGDEDPQSIIDTVNKFNGGNGPYFSPEFYPGWLDHWGERHSISPVDEFIGKYDTLLMRGISVSLYMFHGGTNFGFMNGANYSGHYQPQPTSYDYDAPLDEAGRPTPKYFRLRDVIRKHLPEGTTLPEVPQSMPAMNIPPFALEESTSIFTNLPKPIRSNKPLAMEEIGQSYGYILYRTKIIAPGSGVLMLKEVRDYAIVLLNGKHIASLDRRHRQRKVTVDVFDPPATLDILVENGGRVNYGREMWDNRKGITDVVTFNGKELADWHIFPLPLENISTVHFSSKDVSLVPLFYRGRFLVGHVGDTFLDMRGWGKGCVWVNGHNLGRFWYIGPQQTLYLPGAWMKEGENQIVVFALEDHSAGSVQGLENPILDHLEPDMLQLPPPPRVAGTARLNQADIAFEGAFAEGEGPQDFNFTPVLGRYICLQSLASQKGDPFASLAELYALDASGKVVPRDQWKVAAVDCEELIAEDGRAENAFDDDPETIWHTTWGSSKPNHPHYLIVDMGATHQLGGFRCLPRRGDAPGKIKKFRFYVRQQAFETTK